MAHDVVSMIDIFPACLKVLQRELKPLKYTDLTTMALDYLGIPFDNVNYYRQIEDVREKMLLAGRYGTFYVGEPYCLAALNSWFSSGQMGLFNFHEPVVIPGSVSSGIAGAYEAIKRSPFMIPKTTASIDIIHQVRASGLVVEQHIAHWFKSLWPEQVLKPDNYQKWEQPCDHDFKLLIHGKTFNVDVFGPKRDGTYSQPPLKKHTHFHLLCRPNGKDVLWEGIITGNQFRSAMDIVPEIGRPPQHLIVLLNCERDGIPYQVIRSYAA